MSLEDIQMNSADFLEKAQLDAGGFGMVSLCYHKEHGLVVLKTVYTGPKRTEGNVSLLEEGKIMQKLNHDRVVKLLGIILEDGNYSLVMEYMHKGNLMKVLKATEIPLAVKGRFILEIIEGMLYLSEQGLVHKDLKPENILVDEDFHIKIADLGVACFRNWSRLTKEETSRQRKLRCSTKSNAGTLFYMAPEHLQSINSTHVEKSDVYSFGIVLWAIFANKEPYENATNDQHVYFCVMQGNRPLVEEIMESCPEKIISLMKRSWSQIPEDRPTFAEISMDYKPFYHQHFEKYVEGDVEKIKEVYPEPAELVKRMQSLQVDAVAEPPSSNYLPSSLHSSQHLAANTVDEALFAACSENEPIESCETSFEPHSVSLDRKLQEELNYHMYGSRMDKVESPSVAYSAEMQEEERRRRVSHDPFAKAPASPRVRESYLRAENPRSNVTQNLINNPGIPLYGYLRQRLQGGAPPARQNIPYSPNNSYGVRFPEFRASMSAEDMYTSHSANTVNFSKPPVPESGADHQSSLSAAREYFVKGKRTCSDPEEFNPSMKANFAQTTATHRKSTDESAQYNIVNSCGIQIGPNNFMAISDQNFHIGSHPTNSSNVSADYRKLFDSTAVISDVHLNLVRENLAKQWKHCARKLGFRDPELDEIDHDYERDGLKEKVYQMLQKWQMKEGSKGTTVGKLAKALFACKRIDLLNNFVKISQDSEMSN
ncbi:receptor-interacting serine/threonine-protein kinase 1 [Sphaerodactylus townsendi]|uniref:receptor-interacting serine/threonine-protein kinase 1 n=1 Tax=Sphaerodactylus townsendi TaxID=933632 RepID=UPI002026C3B5|nr:receptor-interacting serine/threonine-protein kinase 1 [Sphaerodactylus townsendi]